MNLSYTQVGALMEGVDNVEGKSESDRDRNNHITDNDGNGNKTVNSFDDLIKMTGIGFTPKALKAIKNMRAKRKKAMKENKDVKQS